MNIALVIEHMEVTRGGRETSVAQTASALAAAGHRVTILCQQGLLDDPNVELAEFPVAGVLRVQRLAHFVREITPHLDQFDIVHATLPIPGCNVYQPRGGTIPGQRRAAIRRRGLLGPLWSLTNGLNIQRRMMAQLERQVVGSDAWCLGVSEMVSAEFAEHFGRTSRVRTVFNAVELPDVPPEQRAKWRAEVRQELKIADDDPVFITAAGNFALKGIDHLIRSVDRWIARGGPRNARLLVVGRENPEGYQRISGLRGLGRQIIFLPPTRQIFRLYSAADACVLLSWYDACSRVVLEALGWGLPTLTTRFNGASELAGLGTGVVVASPDDHRAVVDGLSLLAEPEPRQQMARKCLELAPQVTMERHIAALLKVYEEVMKDHA